MAALEITPAERVGFLIPEATLEVWKDETTAGEAGPKAGVVEAQMDGNGVPPRLVLGAVGTQTADTTLEVLTQQGGNLGTAGAVWRELDDDDYRGRELPNVNTGWAPTIWTGTNVHRAPHPVVTAAGVEVVLCASRIGVATTWSIWAHIHDPVADTYSAVLIESGLYADYMPSPVGLALRDGRILCSYWFVNALATKLQLAVRQSRDGGLTWSVVTLRGLPVAFSLSGGTTYTPRRLAWGEVGGALVLYAHLTSSTSHEYIYGYGSNDGGANWTAVTTLENVGFPEVVTKGTRCVVGLVQCAATDLTTVAYIAKVVSAFRALTLSDFVAIAPDDLEEVAHCGSPTGTWNLLTGTGGTAVLLGDLAMCVWGEKSVAVFTLKRTLHTNVGRVALVDMDTLVATTVNDFPPADAETWWHTSTGADYPSEFRAVLWRGQVHLHAIWWSAASAFNYQVGRLTIGGWATNTMPIDETSTALEDAHGWQRTQAPTNTMDAFGWTYHGTGSVSTTSDPAWEEMITTAAQGYYTQDVTVADTGELVIRAQLKLNSGGGVTGRVVMLGIRFGFAGHGSELEVRCSGTQARARDVIGALDLVTVAVDFTNGGEIEIAMSDQLATVRARSLGRDEDRAWTPLVTGQVLSDDAGAGGTVKTMTLGARASGTADQSWRVVGWSAFAGTACSAGQANPDDLRAGEYTASPSWFGKGVSVGAHSGPAVRGDLYQIPADARFPLRNLLARGTVASAPTLQGGLVCSPRVGWRGTATSGRVAFRYQVQAEVAAPVVLGVHVEASNAPSFAFQGYSSGSWSTLATFSGTLAGIPFTRKGDRVRVNTAGTFGAALGTYARNMEHAGGYLLLSDGGSPAVVKVRPIRSNAKGRISNAGTDPLPTWDLDGIDGTEPTSGTATLYYPRGTLLLALDGTEAYEGFALYWSSVPYTYEGDLRAGAVAIGAVVIPGNVHTWGWARQQASGTSLMESEAGIRFGRVVQPPRRATMIPWTTPSPEGFATRANGAYFAMKTAGPIVARPGDEALTWQGLFAELEGAHWPTVYIPRVGRNEAPVTMVGDRAGIYGRIITENVTFHAISGTRQYPDFQGDTYTIEEET